MDKIKECRATLLGYIKQHDQPVTRGSHPASTSGIATTTGIASTSGNASTPETASAPDVKECSDDHLDTPLLDELEYYDPCLSDDECMSTTTFRAIVNKKVSIIKGRNVDKTSESEED